MSAAHHETGQDRPPVLELVGVTITFRRNRQPPLVIIEGFDLQLQPATIHCLAGRSGSGKTTLIRVAAGLLPPTKGEVNWFGRRIDNLDQRAMTTARRGRVSYVDQDATSIAQLNTLDNVLLPAVPAGITKKTEARAHELLAMLGLTDQARTPASVLSGGERQRLALARALLLEPPLIAIDEPTASLDRRSANTVIDALRDAADQGTCLLVSSHDPELINAADTVTRLE